MGKGIAAWPGGAPLIALALVAVLAGPVHAAKIDDAAEAAAEARDDDALKLYEEILADPKTDAALRAAALVGRGELYSGSRRADQALADFTAALALSKDPAMRATTYIDRAEILSRQGKTAEAIDDYAQSLTLAPGQIGGHTQKGALLQRMGNKDAALAEYDAELKIHPNYYRALVGRAQILGLPLPPDPETGPDGRRR